MNVRVRRGLSGAVRGVLTAVVSMAVYAVPVGCLLALTLLVMSMEEGGVGLTGMTMPLTQAVVLLTQGVGFRLGSLTLGIIPLLPTILLILLIGQFSRRLRGGGIAYLAGLAAWVAMDLAFAHATDLPLCAGPVDIAARGAIVYTLGQAAGTLPGSRPWRTVLRLLHVKVPAFVRRILATGAAAAAGVVAAALLTGLVAVVVWTVAGHGTMAQLFEQDGMGVGSRILTTVLCVCWLPNAAIWALSWCSGAGFAIGELASFTMWTGQADGLPPLPVFGLLPDAVEPAGVRIAWQLAVPVAAAIIALLALLIPRGMGVRFPASADRGEARRAAWRMAGAAAALCWAACLASVGFCLLFALSGGALGTERLAHVGVDVMVSTQAVGRTAALGMLVAWLALAVAMAAAYGIHCIVHHHRKEGTTDDSNKPTDQTGPGLRLP